jgi:hypothetical protein
MVLGVIFSHTHRQRHVIEKYFVREDVTNHFPFLVTPLSPYYGSLMPNYRSACNGPTEI